MGLGDLWWSSVLDSALPPQRLRPDAWPEDKDPASHMAQKKRKKERKNRTDIIPNKMVKAKLNRQKSHKETHTHTHKKRKQTNKQTKNPDRTLGQMVKANLNRQSHTKKRTHTHSQKEKKGKI